MATLSACVITKNEADNIFRCLNSIKDIVKEMIVVDTGSTDDTIRISEELGARIFHFDWNNDFSAARNYALEQATGDWILFLDADEYISEDKVHNIPPLIAKINGNRKFSAIACLMEHTDGVDGPLKCQDKTVRLFRNSSAIRYAGRIHESIYKHGKLISAALYVFPKELSIIHTGYKNTNFLDKIRRNLRLLEKDLENGDIHYLTYYYLCHSYTLVGQFDKAIEYARKAIADGNVANTMFAHKPYIILVQCLQQTSNCKPDIIEPILAEALQIFAHHPEVLACQGNYLLSRGYYTKALDVLLQALKANDNYNDIDLGNDFFSCISQVQETIAAIYEKKGDTVQALDYYVQTLKTFKYNVNAFSGLLSLLRSQEAANIVYLLNTIYNTKEEEDICFIVTRLSALKVLQPLAYYEKIWSESFKRGVRTGMLPFLHNDLEQAFILFASAFKKSGDYQAELMATVTVLLGNKPLWLEALEGQWQPSFRRIAKIFLGLETNVLTEADFPRYLDIMANFAHLCSNDQMNHLLQIGLLFFLNDSPMKIAKVLENHYMFQHALTVYDYELNRSDNQSDIKALCFRAGICCYKLKDYQQALQFFTQALRNGYTTPDIHEYLNWTQKQCPDSNRLPQKTNGKPKEIDSAATPPKQIPKKHVLIGSPIRQKPQILKEFLLSLKELKTEQLDVSYLFFDDNDNNESSKLLTQFSKTTPNVMIRRSESNTDYLCDDTTHQWNEQLIWKVADLKNKIIASALESSMDYLFLIDSDLMLHPDGLQHLVSLEKDIVSQVFWTKWQPGTLPQPQVWLYDQYTQYQLSRGETVTVQDINLRTLQFFHQLKKPGIYEVGGLGACTAISRKALEAGVNFNEIKNITFWGEDRHFCVRAATLGFALYADTHYSVYHIYREKDLEGVSAFKKKCGYQTKPAPIIINKQDVPGNKITLSMVIKNEAERYLKRALTEHLSIIDAAVIIDDGSTDNSIELCEQILTGIPTKIIKNDKSLFSNEVELRKLQWNETVKTNPDWILNLDADEIFEKKFNECVKQIIAIPDIYAYCFRLYDFWNEKQFREDKYWCAHLSYRPFLVKYNPNFHYKWNEQPQHCGRFPNNILALPCSTSDLRVKHLGWAKKTDRTAKYERYNLLDPHAVYGIKEQYESILDKKPHLIEWIE